MDSKTKELLELAEKNITIDPSALVCLDSAKSSLKSGRISDVHWFAYMSLAYSVGIMHQDFKRAFELITNSNESPRLITRAEYTQ